MRREVEIIKKRIVLLFVLSIAFATILAVALNMTANAQGYGDETAVSADGTTAATPEAGTTTAVATEVAAGEKCGAAHDRNGDGMMDTWDRNMDGDMDAFDVNFDGTIDSLDPSISCATTTASRLPLTGAPALAIAAIAAAMMGTGYALRRSRS